MPPYTKRSNIMQNLEMKHCSELWDKLKKAEAWFELNWNKMNPDFRSRQMARFQKEVCDPLDSAFAKLTKDQKEEFWKTRCKCLNPAKT